MKLLLSLVLTTLVYAATAGGQSYVTPPLRQSLFSSDATIPFVVVGGPAPGPASNVPPAIQAACAIGVGGYSLAVNMSGTNSASTTNVSFILEHSYDSVDWPTNCLRTWVVGPLGSTYAPVGTNQLGTEAGGTMGNLGWVRLKSINHSNAGAIFITNLSVQTRLDAKSKRR